MMLTADEFGTFFRALWHYDAFPWQCRLARQVCDRGWPAAIDLPTASGKTACIDVAVFALAVQARRPPDERTVGRRIFFVVNRRVIVDQAARRARSIAQKLHHADETAEPILREVASVLRAMAGHADAPALDAAVLRGGIYRDNRWARSITQPTVIASTVDQVGSRLLFRGYGVSEFARPLHAALVAHDSTIFVDEAHISQPFMQTLNAARRFRSDSWAVEPIHTPFAVVPMTATPAAAEVADNTLRLSNADEAHPVLRKRLHASKPVSLRIAAKARGKKATDELASVLVERATESAAAGSRTVAVVVNRIATARTVYRALTERVATEYSDTTPTVHLVIGRMRPLDRDDTARVIEEQLDARARDRDMAPVFIVATQCLEVGADFDFDAMVTECASFDALRQRFGRLNRTGRDIDARGCIVIRADQLDGQDPIYGAALGETWRWLASIAQPNTAEAVDFGIAALAQTVEDRILEGQTLDTLMAPRADAPVMFPAYMTAWVQTSPSPRPDPEIACFLHGPDRGEPDVNVCWRADLPAAADRSHWTEIVSLFPPSSPECMPVPIGVVRTWMRGEEQADDRRGDTFDAESPENTSGEESPGSNERNRRTAPKLRTSSVGRRVALAWRGPSNSELIEKPGDVRPGDTLVLPVATGGWSVFGYVPDAPADPSVDPAGADDEVARIDLAERASRASRGRITVRLWPGRLRQWSRGAAAESLENWISDPDIGLSAVEIRSLLHRCAEAVPPQEPVTAAALDALGTPRYGLIIDRYPGGSGVILSTRRVVPSSNEDTGASILPAMDDGGDEASRTRHREPISLSNHTAHVREALETTLECLPRGPWTSALVAAADRHDWGKADDRFQALLINRSLDDVWAQPTVWAKSAWMPLDPVQRLAARERSDLPAGFRHEMLSVQLADKDMNGIDAEQRDLVLHLIASHHGRARPFAPVVFDIEPPDVSFAPLGASAVLTSEERKAHPLHRLDAGVPERFWMLTHRLGWWAWPFSRRCSGSQIKQPARARVMRRIARTIPEQRRRAYDAGSGS